MDDSEAWITRNTITGNYSDGIAIRGGSKAVINGGTSSRNLFSGVFLSGASTADIGLERDVLTLSQNGRAGIEVIDDGSLARINRTRIVFDSNAYGDIVGPFTEP